MKALIFNSGLGSRMAGLTENNPKCMVKLYNGETIFERQIRILSECGIKDFIITTGPFKEQLYDIANKFRNLHFDFVANDDYKKTNYIVSMNNANIFLDDDVLLLHGDLVFNKNLVIKLLENKNESVCLYDETKSLPEKDFKCRFKDNKLLEVSINIFDNDCYAFQPLYKLSKKDLTLWKNKVAEFVSAGYVNVYAENALNEISHKLNIQGMSYKNDYIDEIDNEIDYNRVLNEIKFFDYREQPITVSGDYFKSIKELIGFNDNIFVVCSNRLTDSVKKEFVDYEYSLFTDFTSNPKYEEIKKGVELFKKRDYKVIISIGGGSAIDVAKCIKLFSSLENEYDFLEKKFKYNNMRHIAVPTTAGSGSESTQIAVMYHKGKKISIDYGCALPDHAILCSDALKTLPDYQKKSTILDSLCQAVESFWSKGATEESKEYSKKCIRLILNNYKDYLNGKEECYEDIITASNYSGRAINITRTTAAHSMSYKLTTDYNISHGHAVALCIIPVWKLLLEKSNSDNALKKVLIDLACAFGTEDISNSIDIISEFITDMKLPNIRIDTKDIDILVKSVDLNRMNNNPVMFTYDEIYDLYKSYKL
ncbi:MAG: iron-containing alcohol dehydrogenase [Clostridia bacterium]|nr:iron-containing alcohol dehydrogenase [Clostridia bacterium]